MLRKNYTDIAANNDELIKSKFKSHQYVGDPINAVRIFNEIQENEIILLDVFNSKKNTDLNYKIIKDIADECRMPFTYGGGIKNLDQVENLFSLGVEKICLNTSILHDYEIIKKLSKVYGSQSIIISIDIYTNSSGEKKLYNWSENKVLDKNINDHILKSIESGAGEILINDVDKEGTLEGFDFDILKFINKNINVPIIVNGGVNSYKQIKEILKNDNVDAVGVGALFIYYGPFNAVLISYMPVDVR